MVHRMVRDRQYGGEIVPVTSSTSETQPRPCPIHRVSSRLSCESVQSILFVELLGGIGDLLMALPAIHALARSHPGSRVSVLTFRPGGELLEADPEIAEVLCARRGPDVGDAGPPARRDLASLLAARSFDLIVSDTRYARIHELIEGSTSGRAVTHLWRDAGRDEPIERLFLRRLVEEGVVEARFADLPTRLPVAPEEEAWAARWWAASGLPRGDTVVLNPHSGMPIKRWPAAHFVELGRALRRGGRPVAVLAGELPDAAESVAAQIPEAIVVPPARLRRLAGLVAGVGALVSADTGPAKVAAAVGTPVVGVFGPTWAGRYGHLPPSVNLQSPFDCPELNPLNFTVQRCWYSGRCIFPGKASCCEDVRPEQALAAVEGVLASRNRRGSDG